MNDNEIIDITATGDEIWALTGYDEVVVWEIDGNLSKKYAADDLDGKSPVSLEAAPDGSVWIGTTDGIAKITGGVIDWIKGGDGVPLGTVYSIAFGSGETIWVGTYAYKVCRFDGERWERFTPDDGLSLPGDIEVAPNGDVWVTGRDNNYLYRYRDGWENYTNISFFTDCYIKDVTVASDGTVFVGTTENVIEFKNGIWSEVP